MNKVIEFMKKHWIMTMILGGIGGILLLKVIAFLCKILVVCIVEKSKNMICYIVSQQFADKLIEYSHVSTFKFANAICGYIEICIGVVALWIILVIPIAIIVIILEKIFDILNVVVLGKNHQRSLKYNCFQIWFIKVHSDANRVILWIKYYICGVRYSNENDISMVRKAKFFTVENIICIVRNCCKFFFRFSVMHMLFAIYVIYIFYKDELQTCLNILRKWFTSNFFSISDILDVFGLISIILLLVYIFLDIRHKANGYSEIRVERFKELFQMEEKLLNILGNIIYSLETNIDIIVDRKQYILQSGGDCLTGKECYIYDGIIEYEDKNYMKNHGVDEVHSQLKNLQEMSEEFKKLAEVDEKFKQSSLNYSNIFMIDHQAMLTRLVHFYFPGHEKIENKKMEYFCKSSMELWFDNRFIKPTKIFDDKIEYYSEERAKKAILEASCSLDFELMNAFELEVYLKRYERKMIKRIKKINTFSRFNLN